MKRSPHSIKHGRKKAVRRAQSKEPVLQEEKKVTPKQRKDLEKKKFLTTEKKLREKKSHLKGHKSKRTSPKEVTFETEPEHIHKEGEYWIRRTQRQVLDKVARLTKRLLRGTKRFMKKFKKK